MKVDELKKHYGAEYPAAIIVEGLRIPLTRETRFSRIFRSEERKLEHDISRFMDGSASITFGELEREWPGWKERERMDFCGACSWLHEQADFPDMLRFIMKHSGPDEWSAIALDIACCLPQKEAFDFLLHALSTMDIGETSNIGQAIAKTKHPNAGATMRRHLQSIWAHPSFRNDDRFLNWVAFDATTCIARLIELGASPADFEAHVRQLSSHVCSGNRDSCRRYLSKHYSWLQNANTTDTQQK